MLWYINKVDMPNSDTFHFPPISSKMLDTQLLQDDQQIQIVPIAFAS